MGRLEKWRGPRRLKTTRDGKYFIAITLGVGFVGIMTANNLLYILLGMLLALIIVSGILSEASLRSIKVERKLPARAQVEKAHFVEIKVFNQKKRLPSYAIEVEDLRVDQPADKRCFFLKIAPESSQVAIYRRIPKRRGIDQYAAFRVATRFPFGLFEKSRRILLEDELVIYPAVDSVELPRLEQGDALEGGDSLARGEGDEFFGLRLRQEGDDPRNIYWKRSTAGGPEVVIERSRNVRKDQRFTIVDQVESIDSSMAIAFEKTIRELASRCVAHLKRGERVAIETSSGQKISATPATGADPLLRFLAFLQLQDSDHLTELAEVPYQISERPPSSGEKSLFTAPVQLSTNVQPTRREAVESTETREAPAPPSFRGQS